MEDVKGRNVTEEKININEICKCNEDATKEDEFESTKSEMTGVREENLRLKTLLQQIEKDYKSLQMKFKDIFHQEFNKNGNPFPEKSSFDQDQEQELVSLCLGTNPTQPKKEDIQMITSTKNDALKLGLECNVEGLIGKTPGPENYCSKKEDDEAGEKWPPSKVLKTQRSGDEEFSQTSVKRARVCVRARCDTPTMNDGCQWRKYGQKIAKGNPCPRAYYRCTASPSCPVRKQVQRCVQDMSILITTYEGTHNHPLPLSATAMASTTAAAASMLLSGSSTSQPSANTNLYTLPPYHTNYSSSSPFPTITLDLTTTTTHGGLSQYLPNSRTPARVPSTNLSFSSMESNMVPTVWGNGGFCYGSSPYKNDQKLQSYLEKFNQGSSQQALTETLTKVITSDPNFRSVIAAAISSMATGGGENLGQK